MLSELFPCIFDFLQLSDVVKCKWVDVIYLKDRINSTNSLIRAYQLLLFDKETYAYYQNKGVFPNILEIDLSVREKYITTAHYLAKIGNLSLLVYAYDEGVLLDETVCSEASKRGHLNILHWARSVGCPWNEETCSHAANK